MKKSKILALLLALLMCLSLVACSNEDKPAEEEDDQDVVEQNDGDRIPTELTLGFIGPLTGGAALYGTAAANGAEIAVAEINANDPDFTINLIAMDDEHDAEKAVNAYGQLLDRNVQAIIGCVTSTPCNAAAAEAMNDRVFMLSPSASSPSVLEGRDNIYQLCFSDSNQGGASAQYISEQGLATKVAVIYNNSDAYSTGIYQNFTTAAETYGLELVSVTTFTEDTQNDFSVQLAAARDAGAELVFLPIYYTPAALILNQAKAMDYEPSFFGCDGLDGILNIEGFDTGLAEGLMLLTPFAADAEDEMTQSFVEQYRTTYGETPSQFAADGYDCVYAMYYACIEANVDVNDMDYADFCELMISVFSSDSFSITGLTGGGQGMSWSATGEVNKEPKAVVIKDGVYTGM